LNKEFKKFNLNRETENGCKVNLFRKIYTKITKIIKMHRTYLTVQMRHGSTE